MYISEASWMQLRHREAVPRDARWLYGIVFALVLFVAVAAEVAFIKATSTAQTVEAALMMPIGGE